jgi:hypothetical protein
LSKKPLTLEFASCFSLRCAHRARFWRKTQSILLCGGQPFGKRVVSPLIGEVEFLALPKTAEGLTERLWCLNLKADGKVSVPF